MSSVELDALRNLCHKVEGITLPALNGGASISGGATTLGRQQQQLIAAMSTRQRELARADVVHAASVDQAKAGLSRNSANKASASLDGLSLTALGPRDAVGADAPLAACPALRVVTVRGNAHMTACNVQGHVLDALPELRELSLDSNPSLTVVADPAAAQTLTHGKLESLSLSGNGLPAVPDLYMQRLTSLDVSGNGALLKHFPVASRLPLLTTLDIARNGFTTIESLSSLIHLSTLNVSCNKLVSLVGIESMTRLEKLDASGNRLRFNRSTALANPLRGCSATLASLDVSQNDISTLAFFVPMPKLWWLDVSGNPFGSAADTAAALVSNGGSMVVRRPGSASGKQQAPRDDIGDGAYGDEDEETRSVTSSKAATAVTAASAKGSKAGTVRTKVTTVTAKTAATSTSASGGSGAAQGPFLTRLCALCPNVESLDVSSCPGAIAQPSELAALARLTRLSDLKIDVGVVAPIVAEKNAAVRGERALARQNRRQAKLLKKAAQVTSNASTTSYQDRMSRAFDFGAPAAPPAAVAPAAASSSSSDDDADGADALDDDDDIALAEALEAEVSKYAPTLETLNGETRAKLITSSGGTGLGERPMTARTAADRVIAEEEVLASVLDAETLAALREVGFDANRAAAEGLKASARPTSARQARPTSASATSRGTKGPLHSQQQQQLFVDPVALRHDLDSFLDQLQASKDYALESLDRIDQRLQWAYGNGEEVVDAPLHQPMHVLWSETSKARREAMEQELAQQREARREAQKAKALALLAKPNNADTDAKPAAASPAVVASPAPPSLTPTKPPGRSHSSPRPTSSSSSVSVSLATLPERPSSNDATQRRTGLPGRRSHSSTTAPSVAPTSSTTTSSGGGAKEADKKRSTSASSRTTNPTPVVDKARTPSNTRKPSSSGTPLATSSSLTVAPTTAPPAAPLRTSTSSRSFAEEQLAFKRQMEADAERRRHAALLQLPGSSPVTPLSASFSSSVGTSAAPLAGFASAAAKKPQKVTCESGTSMDDARPSTQGSASTTGTQRASVSVATTSHSVGIGPMSPPRRQEEPAVDADPLAKFRLRPVDADVSTVPAKPTATAGATNAAPVAKAPAHVVQRAPTQTNADVDSGDDDSSSVGDISDEEDDDDGAPAAGAPKGVVVGDPRRQSVQGDPSEQRGTPVDLLRPSSANINTRHQSQRPTSSSGAQQQLALSAYAQGTGMTPVPFSVSGGSLRVAPANKQGNALLKSSTTTAPSAAATVQPAMRSSLVVPVSGNGQTAPVPKHIITTANSSARPSVPTTPTDDALEGQPESQRPSTSDQEKARAAAAVAAAMLRIEQGDVYRTQPKPVVAKAMGSLNRRR